MARVGIVTDSTCCMPPELIEEYGIKLVPYHLMLEGKDYLDRIDITPDEFWARFPGLKEIPTTGIPGPGLFAAAFTELAGTTGEILCVTVSSGVSAVARSVEEAKSEVLKTNPGLKIEHVDSKTSVGAMAFIVLEAARAAKEDKDLQEITALVNDMVARVRWICALDTLEYLIKGGRAPKTAIIGEILGVKPLIGFVNASGVVESLGRERGKQKAMARLVSLVSELTDTDKPLHVMAHYTTSREDGERLKDMVASRYRCAELYLTDLTPVITTHTGPSLALSFYSK